MKPKDSKETIKVLDAKKAVEALVTKAKGTMSEDSKRVVMVAAAW
ncbi:hypothetical protein GL267_009305 [Acidithiobacillus ferrianus]|uniref:Uncharacterized protein n=1 Tax=Acidithiobacillus ferrianus TaxID=2678518 RepID=A0ACD5H409_9PROT|nr:hypothetical protein [Acidithiobacillus ferrianus]